MVTYINPEIRHYEMKTLVGDPNSELLFAIICLKLVLWLQLDARSYTYEAGNPAALPSPKHMLTMYKVWLKPRSLSGGF
jgi:hypothetical protein